MSNEDLGGNLANSNLEIEQALLGALLVQPNVFDYVSDILPNGEYFYTRANGDIYNKIYDLASNGKKYDAHILKPFFENHEDLSNAGGGEYLFDLVNNVISTVNSSEYAITIKNLYLERRIKDLCRETVHNLDSEDHDRNLQEVLSNLENEVSDIGKRDDSLGGCLPVSSGLDEALYDIDQAQKGVYGVRTGISALDRNLKGLRKKNLYVLAGRPGMGKTAAALTMAVNSAVAGSKTMFFSLEMGKGQLMQRVIARFSGISADQQMERLSNDQFNKIINADAKIRQLPLFLDETASLTVQQIKMRVKRAVRKHQIQVVFIDYLGLIRSNSRNQQKVHQVEEITQNLKAMAKELDIPVVLLCQLSRSLENRDDKRPMLADLRDSGAIEQDADAVMFVYREEYYLNQSPPKQRGNETDETFFKREAMFQQAKNKSFGKAEISIAKQRQGKTGIVDVIFNGAKQVFSDDKGDIS